MGHYTSIQGVVELKPWAVKKLRRLKRQVKRSRYTDQEKIFAKIFGFKHKVFKHFSEYQRVIYFFEFHIYKNYLILDTELKNYGQPIEFFIEKIIPKIGRKYKFFVRDEDEYTESEVDKVYTYEKSYRHYGKLETIPFQIIPYKAGKYNFTFYKFSKGKQNLFPYLFKDY